MVQHRAQRPPPFLNVAEMKRWSSKFDEKYRSATPIIYPEEEDDEPSRKHEHRAAVIVGKSQEWEQSTHNTSTSLASRAKASRAPNRRPRNSTGPEEASITSVWSKSSNVKPLFTGGDSIASSKQAESATIPNNLFQNDDPWRAAKRGDLPALKKFQATGKVNWMKKDEFQNIPLYYACHSGAIADVMVVPFLLWVTTLNDPQILEKCRKDAINQQVRSILRAYKQGGLAAVAMGNMGTGSVDSSKSSKADQIPGKTLSFDLKSSKQVSKQKSTMTSKRRGLGQQQRKEIEEKKASEGQHARNVDHSSAEEEARDPPAQNSADWDRSIPQLRINRSTSGSVSTDSKNRERSNRLKGAFPTKFFRRKNKEAESVSSESTVPKYREQHSRHHPKEDDADEEVESVTFQSLVQKRDYVPSVADSTMETKGDDKRSDFPIHGRPPRPDRRARDERREEPFQDSREERDARPTLDEREDWDKPIEHSFRYGGIKPKGSMSSLGRDDDSWSIGSMLSLKKWRNNRKQLDAHKIDRILGTDKSVEDGHSLASLSTNLQSFDSHSHRRELTSSDTRSRSKGPQKGSVKPYIEYNEHERTWVIANQQKPAGNSENDKMVHVCDNKQRVHVVNCHDVNVHVHGRKMKALLVDNCTNVNVIFDTVITTCEVVNCSRVGLQATGICPHFAIDLSDDVTVWLTVEGMKNSNFVTSKFSNVTISVPRGDDAEPWDRKEIPLPAQYIHKFKDGGVMSHLPGYY